MVEMAVVGIDPGKSGGIAVLEADGKVSKIATMPDLAGLKTLLTLTRTASRQMLVFLEKAQVMPGNGLVSMFNYGMHNGEIMGMLFALGIPFELVGPNVWTKVMHAGCTGDRPKEKSKQAAQRLFPEIDLKNPDNPRARIPHDGLIDALLIAEWGRRKLKGGI